MCNTMVKNKICRFNNKLVEAKMDLQTAEELKLFSVVVSQINMEDEDFVSYEVYVEQIEKLSGKKKNEKQIRLLAERMLKKTIFINEATGWVGYAIFNKIRYVRGQRKLEVSFHPDLKPYLLNIKNNFTKAKLQHIVHLSSGYAIRLFLLVKQYQQIGKREIQLAHLHELLQTPSSYRRNFADFYKRVIMPSVEEINGKTDMHIQEVSTKKTGKKIDTLVFHF